MRESSASPSEDDRRPSCTCSGVISMCGSILPLPLSFLPPMTDGEDTERWAILESKPEPVWTFLNFQRTPNWPWTRGTLESWSMWRRTWKRACLGSSWPSWERKPWVGGAVDEEELEAEATEDLFMVMVVGQRRVVVR